jgi:predicted house-cleaning noncanonical NTP pyrophosphatase (MazG superfamily)
MCADEIAKYLEVVERIAMDLEVNTESFERNRKIALILFVHKNCIESREK